MIDAGNTVYRKMKSIHRWSTGIPSPRTLGGDKLKDYESQRFWAGRAPLLSLLPHTRFFELKSDSYQIKSPMEAEKGL